MGSDLHPISIGGRTPLLDLIRVGIVDVGLGEETKPTQKLLDSWIECLHEAGVDLEEYGQVELDLFNGGLVDLSFPVYQRCTKYALTRLAWGPSPSDWEVQLEEQEEEYDMPGGWIEEDQDESNGNEKGGTEDSVDEEEDEEEGFVTGSEGNQDDSEEDADNEETAQEGHE